MLNLFRNQPWMDFYLPRAWRLVMIAEPLSRIASMFYFRNGFTKGNQVGGIFFIILKLLSFLLLQLSNGTYSRSRDDATFYDPLHPEVRAHIAKFLEKLPRSWTETQWKWIRDGTPMQSLQVQIFTQWTLWQPLRLYNYI